MSPKRYIVFIAFLLSCIRLYSQSVPIVIAFFRPGETYTLCFDRTIDYRENWINIAKRYNLNKAELTRFNRVDPNNVAIQQKLVYVPLVFNVNLFMHPTPEPDIIYIPVYYLIKTKQKVSNLHLRFREPILTFIKNYNKIKDHYILNKDAPIFVGYLKISKSYGWNKKSAKDINAYKTYEQVQETMQESVNISKLKQYSVKEKNLIITPDKVNSADKEKINTGAVNVIGITEPDEKSTKKVTASLNPAQLKEQNANFSSYMRREQILADRRTKAQQRQNKLVQGRNSGSNKNKMEVIVENNKVVSPEARKQEKIAGVANAKVSAKSTEPAGLAIPKVNSQNKRTSFFETEYNEEKESGKQEIRNQAKAKLFRLLFDESNGKFYVLANGTPPGSTIQIKSTTTSKMIYAKVISPTPQSIESEGTIVVISENGASALGIKDNAPVEVVLLK